MGPSVHWSSLMQDLASAVLLLSIDMKKQLCKKEIPIVSSCVAQASFFSVRTNISIISISIGDLLDLKRLTPTILCMLCVVWVLQIAVVAEVMNSFNAYFFLVIRARSRLPAHVVSIYETQN